MNPHTPSRLERFAFHLAKSSLVLLVGVAFWMGDCAELTTVDRARKSALGAREQARLEQITRGSPSVPVAVEIAPSLRNVADLLPQPMDRAEISAGLYRDSWFIGAYAIAYCCLAAFLCFRPGAKFRWAGAAAVVLTVITVLCDRAENDATLPVLARLGGDYRPQIPDAERAVVTDAQDAEAQPLLDRLRLFSQAKWYSCFGVGILLSFIFWPAWDQWKDRKWHLLVGALLLFGGIVGIVGGYDSPRVISYAFAAMLAGALVGLPVLLHAPTPQDFWRRQPGV